MELSEEERELILQIRNYKKSKHNPSKQLRQLIRELFDRLLED
jgi:hypothetical protein